MVPPYKIRRLPDPSFDLSRDLVTRPLFHEQKGAKPQRQDRLTGGTGLYIDYLIMFTNFNFVTNNLNNSYDILDETRL